MNDEMKRFRLYPKKNVFNITHIIGEFKFIVYSSMIIKYIFDNIICSRGLGFTA